MRTTCILSCVKECDANAEITRNYRGMCSDGLLKVSIFFFLFRARSERRVIREGLNFHPRCMNAGGDRNFHANSR